MLTNADQYRRPKGRPPVSPSTDMKVGESATFDVPTPADVKRVARNASQYGVRNNRVYICATDMATRVMTVTRTQ